MTLIKTSVLSGIATLISIASRFILNKIVSLYIGPSGLALIGQLQNFVALVLSFANGSINTGVTKYLAEKSQDQNQHDQGFIITALWINVFCAIISGLVVFFGAEQWAAQLLSNAQYKHIFQLFSVTLLFFALNTLFMAILNGKKEIKTYILINILGSLVGLTITVTLILYLGLIGGFYAIVINQSIIFLVTCFFIKRARILSFFFEAKSLLPQKDKALKLASYAMMTFTAAAITPFVNMLIRTHLIDDFGLEETGYWQGVWYISMMYLMLVTTSLKTYLLPSLSSLEEPSDLAHELKKSLLTILPLVIASALSIFLIRDYIILLAFSKDFEGMRNLFLWQLIGDVLKITGWFFGMVLAAKAMIIKSIIANTLFGIIFYGLTLLCTHYYGLTGVTYAYAINYAIFLPFVYFLARPAFVRAQESKTASNA